MEREILPQIAFKWKFATDPQDDILHELGALEAEHGLSPMSSA
jgi:hypothetical protein